MTQNIAEVYDDDGEAGQMSPELRRAIDAKTEYTTMTVSKLDLRRLDTAKRELGRNSDSYRQLLMYLIETHPEIDAEAIERGAVESFVDTLADASE